MKTLIKIILLIALLTMTVSVSYATTISQPNITLTENFDLMFTPIGGVFIEPGKINIDLSNHASVAFCIEIGTSTSGGEVTLENPTSYWSEFPNGNGIYGAWLMDQFTPELGFDYTTVSFQSNGSTVTGVTEQVAYLGLQLAIWEAVYDGFQQGDDNYNDFFSNGDGFFYNAIYPGNTNESGGDVEVLSWDLATYFLTELARNNPDPNSIVLKNIISVADFDPSNNTHGLNPQELLVASPVPEPGSMLLLGFGLLSLTAVSRRKI